LALKPFMASNGTYQNGFGYYSRCRRENGSAVSTETTVHHWQTDS